MTLVGSKWTTFRAFSQEVANLILIGLGKQRIKDTVDLRIGGGANYPSDADARSEYLSSLITRSQLSSERVSVVFERYGTKIEQ